jgi:hypothetical protein
MPFKFRKLVFSLATASALAAPLAFADEPTPQVAATAKATLAPFDESLFEIPSGQSAAFYQERLDRLTAPELYEYLWSVNGPEHGVLRVRILKARREVNARWSECEDASPEDRFWRFFIYVDCSNFAEIRELLAAEKAKKPVDVDRVRLLELVVLRKRLEEAKYFAEKKAIVAEILDAARTKFDAPTPRLLAEQFFKLGYVVDKEIPYPRDFGSNFRRDVAAALQKSSDPQVRNVARALRAPVDSPGPSGKQVVSSSNLK